MNHSFKLLPEFCQTEENHLQKMGFVTELLVIANVCKVKLKDVG